MKLPAGTVGGLLKTTTSLGVIQSDLIQGKTISEAKVVIGDHIREKLTNENYRNEKLFVLSILGGANMLPNWSNSEHVISGGGEAQIVLTCVYSSGSYANIMLTSYEQDKPVYGRMLNWIIK